jgi:DNA-binding NtrC family response regulator
MQSNNARILVVDDDRETGEFLQEHLSSDTCTVTWHAHPRQALQTRRGQFQVGIIDLKLPQINGVELFRRLREKDPDMGLIILTAYPSVDSALATLKKGAYDYVRKPYKIAELKGTVQKLLEEKGYFQDSERVSKQRLGMRIKEFRQRRKWTITRLALQTRLSKSLISQIENAKNSASLISLSKIARSLNVRMTELVQDL